jgi:3-methyladenine DNA glycosylase AlkD
MAAKKKSVRARTVAKARVTSSKVNSAIPGADEVVARLERMGSKSVRDGMTRYAIPSDKAFGVPVGRMKQYAKEIGPSQALAEALWKTGWYEARMMSAFVGEADRLTPALMDRWCKDFDSWAIVDTVCFSLFDRSPHAFAKVDEWSERRDEFGKRAAFALLACLALHGRGVDDYYTQRLRLIERAAPDDRNFVKKGVLWALRGVAQRNATLRAAALSTARRLAESDDASSRWIGRTALREISKSKQR